MKDLLPAEENLPKVLADPLARVGIVLSGGGSRAAYQAGVLKALASHDPHLGKAVQIIVGSSIGAVNGVVLGAGLSTSLEQAADVLITIWRERTYKNSFDGSASLAFFRSIRVAFLQYLAPGPGARAISVFRPTPLLERVDAAIRDFGNLQVDTMAAQLRSVAVMTTVEGRERKSLLIAASRYRMTEQDLLGCTFNVTYVPALRAAHGFASAALPSILPPVNLSLDTGEVMLVDGGIADNIPVDPATRLGAEKIVIIDVSGRKWWFDQYGKSHDSTEPWELQAQPHTFCFHPPEILELRTRKPLGPLLKAAIGKSSRDYVSALGPIWPIFKLLQLKLGESVAYEILSYAALHPEYSEALIELGYNDTKQKLEEKGAVGTPFEQPKIVESAG